MSMHELDGVVTMLMARPRRLSMRGDSERGRGRKWRA